MNSARVIVFGYGELGAACVETLKEAGAEVVALVLPSNRTGPDVDLLRTYAEDHGLNILVQPPRKQIEPFAEELRRLAPDVILVWSYSMILPPAVISVPRLGCVNLHGGLLPEYRGGHVMQWAIVNGEAETGMTLHYIDEDIDTGSIIAVERFPIEWEDDAATIRQKLKAAGMRLIREWWPKIASNTAPRAEQDKTRAVYYRLRTVDDGLINWSASSKEIYNLARALVQPWPGAFTFWRGRKLIIRRALPVEARGGDGGDDRPSSPGLIRSLGEDGMRVACGDGEVLVSAVELDDRTVEAEQFKELGISAGDFLGG